MVLTRSAWLIYIALFCIAFMCVLYRELYRTLPCVEYSNKTFLCTISLISTTFSSDHREVVFGLIHLLLIILL